MATKIILIGVDSGTVKDLAIPLRYRQPIIIGEHEIDATVFDQERRAQILRDRWAFIEKDAFDLIWLSQP